MAALPDLRISDRRALIAIDLGAESCRVSLLRWRDAAPEISLVHRIPNSATRAEDGSLRWQVDTILRGLHEGIRKAAAIATEGVRSIAVDGWAVDYVHLDERGNIAATAFSYRDERTIAAEQQLHETISPERMREITGIEIQRINTAYQLFADEPKLRQQPWLNLPEFILFSLGGAPVSELTNAAHTQMLSLDGSWSDEILAALDIPRQSMPKLVRPGTIVGSLRGPLAELAALSSVQLIAPCCHDTASAVAAIAEEGDDWAYLSSGTWSLVGTRLDRPVNTPAAQAANYTNLCGPDGSFCFHKGMNGMWLLRNCLETWNAEEGAAPWSIEAIVAAAADQPSPQHLLHVDAAELMAPGDMPSRIRTQLLEAGHSATPTASADAPIVASLIFHSLAARYAQVIRQLEELTGKQFRRLHIMGGGSQNALLNRLTAEATGLDVVIAGTECSTTGNFAVQLSTLERTPGPRPAAQWARILSST